MYKDLIKKVKLDFKNAPDLILKEQKISLNKIVYTFFLETVSSSDKVNSFILRKLSDLNGKRIKLFTKINNVLPTPNAINIKIDEVGFYLTNGFAVVCTNFNDEIIAIEVKADLDRGVSSPESQPAINGPKDAFTENYQKNIGLLKRRIKSSEFATIELNVGRRTNTKVGILYFDDIADKKLVKKIYSKLKNIDIDGIVDIGIIGNFLNDENKTFFPQTLITERPDAAVDAMLEGKIVIAMDTSPNVLIIPTFLVDFLNPIVDNYGKSINVNLTKILRFFCFFLSIITPALYIALINYNQESIPTTLLINFSMQRTSVPFPSVVESLIMLVIVEILRESDLRFPNKFGSAVSILGALIIGDSAVSAGLFTPIMIIIVAITLLSSMIFTDLELVAAMRHYRFLFLIGASFLGLLGVVLIFIFFLANLASVESFGKPYLYPMAPFDQNYIGKGVLKNKILQDRKRSSVITKRNMTKQGDRK